MIYIYIYNMFIYIYGIIILAKIFLIKLITDKTDKQKINSHFNIIIKNNYKLYCLLNTSSKKCIFNFY